MTSTEPLFTSAQRSSQPLQPIDPECLAKLADMCSVDGPVLACDPRRVQDIQRQPAYRKEVWLRQLADRRAISQAILPTTLQGNTLLLRRPSLAAQGIILPARRLFPPRVPAPAIVA
ncbi:unnamed protein product [Clonostachys rosea f. rosea IK726]|uniref:Uncharacterized protein n=1 Tax=Clonostachys rosea f. rosea IK726 TaxID=1349383 RepID=A0ACA9UQD7_BIOOC|nr:unnamed protein product [Clonostachys rosea f. rosea IK726]